MTPDVRLEKNLCRMTWRKATQHLWSLTLIHSRTCIHGIPLLPLLLF